jgi:predicted O-methyltransferase YrrM
MSWLSVLLRRGDKRARPDRPWLPDSAVAFLDDFLASRTGARVLEFGGGGSTVWLSRRAAHVISIEHQKRWHALVSKRLVGTQNVDFRLRPLPYFGEADGLPDETCDLVLVDGRDRVECALRSRRLLKAGGALMVDNIDRDRYEALFGALAEWESRAFPADKPATAVWIKPASPQPHMPPS